MTRRTDDRFAAVFDPYALNDERRRFLYSSFRFEPYTTAELDAAERGAGVKFPSSYRFLFENYDGIEVGTRRYRARKGTRAFVHSNALFLPWRGGEPFWGSWLSELRHGLQTAEYLIERSMRLVPFANVTGGSVCLDYHFDSDDPPIVRLDMEMYPSSEMVSFVSDSLLDLFRLPLQPEDPPHPEPCELSSRAFEWYAAHDQLVDSAELSEAERELTLRRRRGYIDAPAD